MFVYTIHTHLKYSAANKLVHIIAKQIALLVCLIIIIILCKNESRFQIGTVAFSVLLNNSWWRFGRVCPFSFFYRKLRWFRTQTSVRREGKQDVINIYMGVYLISWFHYSSPTTILQRGKSRPKGITYFTTHVYTYLLVKIEKLLFSDERRLFSCNNCFK